MSETTVKVSHTAGPWSVRRDGNAFYIKDAAGKRVTEVTGSWEPEVEANARLMAAAPDLLEACELALQFVTGSLAPKLANDLRAAIAKATGE